MLKFHCEKCTIEKGMLTYLEDCTCWNRDERFKRNFDGSCLYDMVCKALRDKPQKASC